MKACKSQDQTQGAICMYTAVQYKRQQLATLKVCTFYVLALQSSEHSYGMSSPQCMSLLNWLS